LGLLPSQRRQLLVLVDGTWRQAHHMLRHSPALREACTSVRFCGPAHSAFDKLRREPSGDCMSTAEACARALRLLEPTEAATSAAEHIEAAVRQLVQTQLDCAERYGGRGSDGRWNSARWTDRRQRTANYRQFTAQPGRAHRMV